MKLIATLFAALTLPSGPIWSDMASLNGQVVVTAPVTSATCAFVAVDPRSLRVTHRRDSCSRTGQLAFHAVPTASANAENIVIGRTVLFRVSQQTAQRGPIATAYDGSAWWVYAPTVTGGEIVRYSLARDRILLRVAAPRFAQAELVVTGNGASLVEVNAKAPRVYRVSANGKTRATVTVPAGRASWAVAHGSTAWVGTYAPAAVWRIDGSRVRRLRSWQGATPTTVVYGDGAIWAIDRRVLSSTRVLRIDPSSGAERVAGVLKGTRVGFLFGHWIAGAFWFVDDRRLFRFKPASH